MYECIVLSSHSIEVLAYLLHAHMMGDIKEQVNAM
jgi:hypothetical protein